MKVKVDAGVDTVLLNDIILARRENGITGYVYDHDDLISNGKNTPIADVTVEVYQNNNGTTDYIGKCKTDANGKYTFAVDKNGSYDLSFIKSGYEDKTESMVFVNGGFATRNAYLKKSISADKGNGTKENPYKVSNVEELKAVKNDLSAYYIQVADIDLKGENWKPIGSDDNPFTGGYDGNGYIINNLTFNDTYSDRYMYYYTGLFIANSGIIENIILENVNIKGAIGAGEYYISALVSKNNGHINNCIVKSGQINSYAPTEIECGISFVGGIAGFNETGGTIENCINSMNINYRGTHSTWCAGITGQNGGNAISKCLNTGDIICTVKSGYNRNGMVYGVFSDCAGITTSGYVKDCANVSNKISAIVLRNTELRDEYLVTHADFIGGSKQGTNYAWKQTKCSAFGGNTTGDVGDITSEYNVTMTDIDTIKQLWNNYDF